MPRIDIANVESVTGSTYPEPWASQMGGRSFQALGDAAGLTQFGVDLVTMAPGDRSSLRHWHEREDEFACVLSGELTLVEDEGETLLAPGDCVGWPRNSPNGHCLINKSDAFATFLVIGTRATRDVCHYSDVDLQFHAENGEGRFTRRNGAPVE